MALRRHRFGDDGVLAVVTGENAACRIYRRAFGMDDEAGVNLPLRAVLRECQSQAGVAGAAIDPFDGALIEPLRPMPGVFVGAIERRRQGTIRGDVAERR